MRKNVFTALCSPLLRPHCAKWLLPASGLFLTISGFCQTLPLIVDGENFNNSEIFISKTRVEWEGSINKEDNSIKTANFQDGGEAVIRFDEVPDRLSLEYKRSGYGQKRTMQIQESPDGSQWRDIFNGDPSTTWTSLDVPLQKTTRYIRLYYDAKYKFPDTGSRMAYWRNVTVTKALLSTPRTTSVQTDMFTPVEGSFIIKAGENVSDDLIVQCDKAGLTLSDTVISLPDARNGKTISYSYTPVNDGKEEFTVTTTEKNAPENTEAAHILIDVITPPQQITADMEKLVWPARQENEPYETKTLTISGQYLRNSGLSVTGDFGIRIGDEGDYVKSVSLEIQAGQLAETAISVRYMPGDNSRRQGALHIGDWELPLTVQQHTELTVAGNMTKRYGDRPFGAEVTTNNSVAPVILSVADTSVVKIENGTIRPVSAGTTVIYATQEETDAFSAATASFTLTIEKATLHIQVVDTVRNYGEPNPEFRLIYEGFVYDDNAENIVFDEIPTVSCEAASDDVDAFPIHITGGRDNRYELICTPGVLSIQLPDPEYVCSADTILFSPGETLLTVHIEARFHRESLPVLVNGDFQLRPETAEEFSSAIELNSEKGRISETLEIQYYPSGNDLYRGSLVFGGIAVPVIARQNTALQLPDSIGAVYGEEAFTVTATGNNKETPVEYQSGNPGILRYEQGLFYITGCGETTLSVFQAGNDVYTEATRIIPVKVEPATLEVGVKDVTIILGEDIPDFKLTYLGFVYGEDEQVIAEQPVITCEATSGSPAGSYPISVSGGRADNYRFNYTPGNLIISNITGAYTPETENPAVYACNGTMHFKNHEKIMKAAVYTTDGTLLKQWKNPGATEILPSLAAGIYLVKTETSDGIRTLRIMIK